MLFDIQFLEQNDSRQIKNDFFLTSQSILCMFDDRYDGIYYFEDLSNHDKKAMEETRALDSSKAFQESCDQYEKLLAVRHPSGLSTAKAMISLLTKDLSERYPTVLKFGFDLGVILLSKEDEKRFLDGATLVFALFPREKFREERILAWPFDSTLCMITIPVSPDDSAFWGMIGSGVEEMLRQKKLDVVIDAQALTAASRRKQALIEILQKCSIMPFYITLSSKHLFLNHAFNVLAAWLNDKIGGRNVSKIAISGETEVQADQDGTVTLRSSPFIQYS